MVSEEYLLQKIDKLVDFSRVYEEEQGDRGGRSHVFETEQVDLSRGYTVNALSLFVAFVFGIVHETVDLVGDIADKLQACAIIAPQGVGGVQSVKLLVLRLPVKGISTDTDQRFHYGGLPLCISSISICTFAHHFLLCGTKLYPKCKNF